MLAPCYSPRNEARAFEYREMFRDLGRRVAQRSGERPHGLIAAIAEPGEQAPASRMAEREEDLVELSFTRRRRAAHSARSSSPFSAQRLLIHHMVYYRPTPLPIASRRAGIEEDVPQ